MTQDTQNVPKSISDLAVKNETLRSELRQEMATLRGELRVEMATLRGDLITELAQAEARAARWWFIAVLAGGLTIAVAILTFAMIIIVG